MMEFFIAESPTFEEPDWVPLGLPGAFSIVTTTGTTWVRMFEVKPRPTWEQLGGYGKELWDYIQKHHENVFPTGSGSRIVATLCYSDKDGYTIFQSTIPRGEWRQNILDDNTREEGEKIAPSWCKAAFQKPEKWRLNVEIHAEDGVEFLCERTKRTTAG
jgi:hypothetical protein